MESSSSSIAQSVCVGFFSHIISDCNLCISIGCLCFHNQFYSSFKHNTSFVSRFSTIRRSHKSATHSPLTRSGGRYGGGNNVGGSTGCQAPVATGSTFETSTGNVREDSLVSTTIGGGRDSRIPGSVSEDSVLAKELSEFSKRNSDGEYIILYL